MTAPIEGYFMDNLRSKKTTYKQESKRLTAKVDAPRWHTNFDAYDNLNEINDKGGSFLDVGCGTNVIGASIAIKYPQIKVTGVDINEKRISAAAKTWKNLPNINAVPAMATALPFAMNRFDFVHSRFLFEYLDSKAETALREMFRVCKRDGTVVVQDIDENMVNHTGMDPELFQDLMYIVERLKSDHVFDPYMGSKLESMFLQNGFVNVKVDKRPYHNCNGAATSDFMQRETKKWNNLIPVLHKIFNDYQKAVKIKDKYLRHLADPLTSTHSQIFTVHAVKPSIAHETKRINDHYVKIDKEENSHVTVRPEDFIIFLLKKEEELQRKLVATRFDTDGHLILSCYLQPLDVMQNIYAFRGVASSGHFGTVAFINRFLQQNQDLTLITKVTDKKIVKSLQVLGFKVFDDSNGGFRAFKSNYGNLLHLYIKEPWNRKSEDDYIRENAIFCIKERCDRKQ